MQRGRFRVAFPAVFQIAVDRCAKLTDYLWMEGIEWFVAFGPIFFLLRCSHVGLQVGGVWWLLWRDSIGSQAFRRGSVASVRHYFHRLFP